MNDGRQQVLSAIGLAKRAGKLVAGEMAVEQQVRGGKAELLLIAADASPSTIDRYQSMAAYYDVPWRFALNKNELGGAIGKATRAAAVVTDKGLAAMVVKRLDEMERIASSQE